MTNKTENALKIGGAMMAVGTTAAERTVTMTVMAGTDRIGVKESG